MSHLVLLGDSIFDNASYVPGRPAVIDQVRGALPAGWRATLVAVDGNVTADLPQQLERLPADATHLAISVGGNDALGALPTLQQPVDGFLHVLRELAGIRDAFRVQYYEMLLAVLSRRLPTIVCTIYDAIPGLEREAACALSLFNDVILREGIAAGLPILDLRLLCDHPSDYSPLSPIEPSMLGGAKIAASLAKIAVKHDFAQRWAVVYR